MDVQRDNVSVSCPWGSRECADVFTTAFQWASYQKGAMYSLSCSLTQSNEDAT